MNIEQGTNFENLTPLEKFTMFRGVYNTLTPTKDMIKYAEVSDRVSKLAFPLEALNGVDDSDEASRIMTDFFDKRDQNAWREAERQEDELKELVNRQLIDRKYDAEKYILFEDANKLLQSTAGFHTKGFLRTIYWDILIETYIHRNAGQTLSPTEEVVLNDPLRIGGFFHPSLAKATEQALYTYKYNSAHAECPMKLLESFDQRVAKELFPIFHVTPTHYEGPKHEPAHNEEFCQHEKEIKQEMLNEWRWQFKYLFKDEPLVEVSYQTVSWKQD